MYCVLETQKCIGKDHTLSVKWNFFFLNENLYFYLINTYKYFIPVSTACS